MEYKKIIIQNVILTVSTNQKDTYNKSVSIFDQNISSFAEAFEKLLDVPLADAEG